MHLNGSHWHLLVNHSPIVGSLLATIVLGYNLVKQVWQFRVHMQ